jgi:uncharacterized protein DUF6580
MPYFYVLVAIVLRLLPHPWNLTPLGAMFLFSGATFRSKRDSLLVPMAALLVSDFAVDRFLYGGTYAWFSPWTWAAFLLVGLIGWALREKITFGRVLGASLTGAVAFFLITNFGVWASWRMYPPNWSGLAACYLAGVPFFRETLLGDLAYSALMFGSYEWLKRRLPALAAASR